MTAVEAREQSASERLEELKKHYAGLQALVRSGEAGEETILEEQRVRDQVLAAEQVHNVATTKAYRERINAETAERRERMNAMLDTGGDLVPRLLLWCADFNAMRDEIQQHGMGFEGGEMQDHLILPLDFADRLAALINGADVEWDFSAVGLFAESQKAERPKRRTYTLRTPKPRSGPPLHYNGPWDVAADRPFEELPEGPFEPFPPIEARS